MIEDGVSSKPTTSVPIFTSPPNCIKASAIFSVTRR
ncbi:Uncharacterised protein [Vibrio cholerae]|nr:Uncharacterised protein [Vibrio cholerae]